MGMTRTVTIDGMEVPFRASAAIPRLYRLRFRRDIFADLAKLSEETAKNDENNSFLDADTLTAFESIAYIMAKHADPSIPNSPEDWLDGFSTFSIYQVLPQILEL